MEMVSSEERENERKSHRWNNNGSQEQHRADRTNAVGGGHRGNNNVNIERLLENNNSNGE